MRRLAWPAGGLLALVAAASLSAAPAQQQPPQTTIAYRPTSSGEGQWLPIDPGDDTLLPFEAAVDGQRAHGIADTGVTFTVLNRDFAGHVKQPGATTKSFTVSAAGGTATMTLGPIVDMDLPYYQVGKLQTTIADLGTFDRAAERSIDLMLGMNVIGAGSLELNLANRRWRLGPTGLTWPGADKAPLRYTADHYRVFAVIDVEGQPLRLGIDTGDDNGLTLTTGAAIKTGLLKTLRFTTIASQGLGGIAVTRMAVPARLHLGKASLSEVPIEIDDGDGLPTQWKLDGMIGTGVFRRLHAALDFPAGTMFYVADPRPPVPLLRSTIGLQVEPDGDGMLIVHVMANSPAALAGWKAGGRLCAVDGVKVDTRPTIGAPHSWNVVRAGTHETFQLCDGTSQTLTARNFY